MTGKSIGNSFENIYTISPLPPKKLIYFIGNIYPTVYKLTSFPKHMFNYV